ncbi:MAG: SpoIIE family protein phosphatase [Deltaproteobacteria bacterium]|nr:SpoIIE family protein phosphatase [Deltaproteobacteria bacterium]
MEQGEKTAQKRFRGRRTLATDLSLSLVLTLFVSFSCGALWEYSYVTRTEKVYLEQDIRVILKNMSGLLSPHVWQMDQGQVARIIDQYDDFYIVRSIRVYDAAGGLLAQSLKPEQEGLSGGEEREELIQYEGKRAGSLRIVFTGKLIRDRLFMSFYMSALTLALLLLCLVLVTSLLLKRQLGRPLAALSRGLAEIGAGHYSRKLPLVPQRELARIAADANRLGDMIREREERLLQQNRFLERLNQAILELVRLSAPSELIRQSCLWFCKAAAAASARYSPGSCELFSGQQAYSYGDALEEEAAEILCLNLRVRNQDAGSFTLIFMEAVHDDQRMMCRALEQLFLEALERIFLLQDQGRHDAEMSLAALIQKSVLPGRRSLPEMAEIHWFYRPALHIGGDWFFFHEDKQEQALYLMMGDVTGHGFSSALLATAVLSGLRGAIAACRASSTDGRMRVSLLMQTIDGLLRNLHAESPLQMSCVVLRWDYRNHQIEYSNAGHPFPLILTPEGKVGSGASCEILPLLAQSSQGTLGDSDHLPPVFCQKIPEGSSLFLYTDGLTEARSPDGHQFGRSLLRCLRQICQETSTERSLMMLSRLWEDHQEGQALGDDCCAMLIRQGGGARRNDPSSELS